MVVINFLAALTLLVTVHSLPATERACCLSSGEICLSLESGSLGDCCDGSHCSEYVPGSGFVCSPTKTCVAPGDLCLSFADGPVGDCCEGPSSCSVFDPKMGGFTCSSSSTTTPAPAPITTAMCVASGDLCLSLADGHVGDCCDGPSSCSVFEPKMGGYTCSSSSTTTPAPTTSAVCLSPGSLCLSLSSGSLGQCC